MLLLPPGTSLPSFSRPFPSKRGACSRSRTRRGGGRKAWPEAQQQCHQPSPPQPTATTAQTLGKPTSLGCDFRHRVPRGDFRLPPKGPALRSHRQMDGESRFWSAGFRPISSFHRQLLRPRNRGAAAPCSWGGRTSRTCCISSSTPLPKARHQHLSS